MTTPHSGEEGSEVVSYLLVQFLVITVFLALVQAAIIVHTRNTAISAASEGARRYAMVGGSAEEAHDEVNAVMNTLLGDAKVSDLQIRREAHGGSTYEVGVVSFRTTLPIFFTLGPPWLDVEGTSIMEDSLP